VIGLRRSIVAVVYNCIPFLLYSVSYHTFTADFIVLHYKRIPEVDVSK